VAVAPDTDPQLQPRFESLVEYWKNYPALAHNRNMWSNYLARNGMAPDTPHGAAVITAETSLLAALNGGTPTPEWSERANALRTAYIEERKHLATGRLPPADQYRKRVSPCPAPAEKTSGKHAPSYGRMNRSLEDFWPIESKRLGEEGIVMVSLRISATGCALAAAISSSSGSEMLDEAVLKFYETIDFLPGEVDGKAIESTVSVPIVFKLRN
jgi:TonB family protein